MAFFYCLDDIDTESGPHGHTVYEGVTVFGFAEGAGRDDPRIRRVNAVARQQFTERPEYGYAFSGSLTAYEPGREGISAQGNRFSGSLKNGVTSTAGHVGYQRADARRAYLYDSLYFATHDAILVSLWLFRGASTPEKSCKSVLSILCPAACPVASGSGRDTIMDTSL